MRDHCGGFHAYSAEFTAALRAGVGGIGVQSTSGTYGYGFKTGSKSTADPWLDAGEYTVFGVADLDTLQGSFQHLIRIDRESGSYAGALDLGIKQNGANVQMAPLLYTSATQGWSGSSFLDIKPAVDFKPGPSLYIFRWKSSAHLQCAITPLGHKNQWVSHTYLPSNIAYQVENDMFAHIGGLGYPGELAWSGHIYMVGLLPYSISDAAADALAKNPWQIFRKVPRVLYFEMAGGTNYTLPLDSGSFTLSGQASSLAHNKILSLAEGSFTLSGSSADLLSNKVLSLEQGSFNVSGQTADLLHNKLLSLENGSFTVTDSDATLLFNRLLELGVGSVTLSGSDATLTYTHGSTYSLVLSEGTFSLGGGSATLVHNKVIPLDSGVFTLSGSDINLIHGKNLTLEAGSFTLSGNDLTFLYNRALPLFSGSITISGGSSTLSYSGVPTISILESLKSYIETQRELKSKITIEIDLKSLL